MTILGVLLALFFLALILPALGVSPDPQIMRIILVVIAVALVLWLFTGSGLLHA